MGIYKIDYAIEKAKENLDTKIANVGLTYEQLNVLFAIAEANSGLKINNLITNGNYTYEADIVRNTKCNALKNILKSVYKIDIDLNSIINLLESELKIISYERTKQHYDEAYVYVRQYTIDTDILVEQGADIYIICIDEDGYFDVVDKIDTDISVFARVRLTDKEINDDIGIQNAIKETSAKIY